MANVDKERLEEQFLDREEIAWRALTKASEDIELALQGDREALMRVQNQGNSSRGKTACYKSIIEIVAYESLKAKREKQRVRKRGVNRSARNERIIRAVHENETQGRPISVKKFCEQNSIARGTYYAYVKFNGVLPAKKTDWVEKEN